MKQHDIVLFFALQPLPIFKNELTALGNAVVMGDVEIMSLLIDAGADINLQHLVWTYPGAVNDDKERFYTHTSTFGRAKL